MELPEQVWEQLKKEIENVKYGRIIIFRSPEKKTFDFTVEHTFKVPIKSVKEPQCK
jgi:hypothetical protein